MAWEKIYLKELHKRYLFWDGLRNLQDKESREKAYQASRYWSKIITKFIKQTWPEKYTTMSLFDILKQDGFVRTI